MTATTVVNLKGHRGDPGYADVVYVGRALRRGGWDLAPAAGPWPPFRSQGTVTDTWLFSAVPTDRPPGNSVAAAVPAWDPRGD